jgi:hypothetical protein
VIIEADTRTVAINVNGTSSDLEIAADELKRPMGQASGKVRSKIKGAILLHPPRDIDSRIGFVERQLDVRICFVVSEQDIKLWLMLLNEIVFQRQRFHLIVDHDELKARDFSTQVVKLEIDVSRILEVASYSAAQRLRLSHINNFAFRILV